MTAATGAELVEIVRRFRTARVQDVKLLEDLLTLREARVLATSKHELDVADRDLIQARDRTDELLSRVRVVARFDLLAQPFGPDWREAYESDDIVALALAELLDVRREGAKFPICSLCGRPFQTLERTDEQYCRRPAPGEALSAASRTCQKLGPQRAYAASLGGVAAVYRARYKALDKRVRRGTLQREQVDAWRAANPQGTRAR